MTAPDSPAMTTPTALNPFPASDEARWREAVAKALKGADFDKVMVGRTADGLPIQPLHPRRADAAPIAGAAAGQRWGVFTRVDHPDPREAAEQAERDLAQGASGLSLVFQGAGAAHSFGLPTDSADSLDRALGPVALDQVPIRLEPAPQARIVARFMAEVAHRRGLGPGDVRIDFGVDPVGLLARTGVLLTPWSDVAARLGDMHAEFIGAGFAGPLLRADGRIIHAAGGTEAQELAFMLASAVAFWRALESRGIGLNAARTALSFTVAVDADQFMGIAKIRALRLLAARLQEACGLSPAPVAIHADTAWRMLTKLDTPVNMLRNGIAVFAAAVGGADSITALPHTSALGLPDAFARRVARNTQSVLMEESHLWRVVDPAAGAGGIEALTDGLAEKAWAAFQEIEREGGVVASLAAGALQARVGAARAALMRGLATGKAPLTGASAFPNLAEKPESVLAVAPILPRVVNSGAVTAPALAAMRLSAPFEALRARAAALAEAGKPARVFLAPLGGAAEAAPRLGFARGFFPVGGVDPVTAGPFAEADGGTDLIALTDAFKASGAELACLCGADARYAEEASDAAMALVASGAEGVFLAGRPGDREAALRQAGVGGFIFLGADVVAALGFALDMIEAS
jgi:methylmalonyl-CoA mutase